MKNLKIISKEIKQGILNNNLKEEIVKMMPYNRTEKCEYVRALATTKTNIFSKYNLYICAKYPAKKNNTKYMIQDAKGNTIWESNSFSIGSYDSAEFLHLGLSTLNEIKEGELYEILSK